MNVFTGWAARARGLFNDTKGPWGSGGGDGSPPPSGDRGPWSEPPRRRREGLGNVTSLDDFLRKSRARLGSGGPRGRFPGGANTTLVAWAVVAFLVLWLLVTTIHRIAPEERGVV